MSEMKFTPGPWRLLPGFAYLNRLSVTLQTGDGKLNLARIFLNGARSREEGTANARLIAAAPELYADALDTEHAYSWLMQVVAEHKQERDSMTAVQINSFLDNLIAYCESHQIGTRAAIAKAVKP